MVRVELKWAAEGAAVINRGSEGGEEEEEEGGTNHNVLGAFGAGLNYSVDAIRSLVDP